MEERTMNTITQKYQKANGKEYSEKAIRAIEAMIQREQQDIDEFIGV
jgi:hypothetical protein